MNTIQKIRQFFGRYIDMKDVDNDDNIFEKGLVNSLFAMQLVSFIENEFDVTINNDELDLANFKDVNSIAYLLSSKI